MDETPMLDRSGSDKCPICLSSFEDQPVGSLQTCPHVFCLQCLLQWSQTSNTCPVDRICFTVIHQRRCPGGDIQKKIKVKTPQKPVDGGDDEEEGGSHLVFCERCGRSDGRHRLLVCTQCESGYHMDCLTPPLNTRPPADDWICPECVVDLQQTDVSIVEDEISDGELTDLLAEVEETGPSISSRLRPSTLNRPSISTEQRRSRRIQGRVEAENPDPGSGPGLRPQTTWHVPKYLLRAPKPALTPEEETSTQSENSSNTVKLKKRKRRRK